MPKFTIQFSQQTDRDLDRLTKARGVNSKAEVVRKAANLLRYVLKEQECEGTLVVENKREKTGKQLIPI